MGGGIETPKKTMKNYKRQFRELSDEHKEKISQATKHKSKSFDHRRAISQAMKDYWRTVPHRPEDNEDLSMDEYLNGR